MNLLETIEKKQLEVSTSYDGLIEQRENLNVEMLRLQGENRAYEFIKEQLKEQPDATNKVRRNRRRRNTVKRQQTLSGEIV